MSRCAWRVLAIVAVAGIAGVAGPACGKATTATTGAPAEPPGASSEAPPQPAATPGTGTAGTVTTGTGTAGTLTTGTGTAGTLTTGTGTAGAPAAGPPVCESLPFAASTTVPEASGAAWLLIDGKSELIVVGDSGNNGAYGVIDPETGATIETGALPLSDGASDDIEGVAAVGDQVFGLTSSGWMRVWKRKGKGFELVTGPYPLGPVDLPDTKNNDRPPRGDGMVCNGRVVNCGRNYEGLCLAPVPRPGAACLGFAASKADGHLYCLTEQAGKLVVHRERAIAIARPGVLADCAFSDDDTLWVGNNLFDLGNVARVTHWEDPANARIEPVGALAIGFPETIAVRGDIVYRMSDMGGSPSLMARYRCRRP